jgi:hypothetical protein
MEKADLSSVVDELSKVDLSREICESIPIFFVRQLGKTLKSGTTVKKESTIVGMLWNNAAS